MYTHFSDSVNIALRNNISISVFDFFILYREYVYFYIEDLFETDFQAKLKKRD